MKIELYGGPFDGRVMDFSGNDPPPHILMPVSAEITHPWASNAFPIKTKHGSLRYDPAGECHDKALVYKLVKP